MTFILSQYFPFDALIADLAATFIFQKICVCDTPGGGGGGGTLKFYPYVGSTQGKNFTPKNIKLLRKLLPRK